MKKLITIILIMAMILPAAALADMDPGMYEGAWTCHEFTTDGGVVLTTVYLDEGGIAYFMIQSFSPEKLGLGRAFVGSWEVTGPDMIHVVCGNKATLDLLYCSYNMMYETTTRDQYFRAIMRDGDRVP